MPRLKKAKHQKVDYLLAKPKRKKPIPMYECVGCKHISMIPTSACDCGQNPENLYRVYRAFQTDDFVTI